MSAAAAALLALLAASSTAGSSLGAHSAEPAGQEATPQRARLELEAPDRPVHVGELVRLRLVLALEQQLVGEELVPLFTRPLELPIQLAAPWLSELASVRHLGPELLDAGPRIALGEREVRVQRLADEELHGLTWIRHSLTIELVPDYAGELLLSGPVLSFAVAGDPGEKSLFGPTISEPRVKRVGCADVALEVLELPEDGRPRSFRGAVGNWDPSLELLHDDELAPGDSLFLRWSVTGDGYLAGFDAPRLRSGPGQRLLGISERSRGQERTVDYEVALDEPGRQEAPTIEFAWFDPRPEGGYFTWSSPSEWLEVEGTATGVSAAGESTADSPAAGAAPDQETGSGRTRLLQGLLLGMGLVLLAAWSLRRGRRREQTGGVVDLPLLPEGADPTDVLVDHLAKVLGCSPAAIIDPGLAGRLEQAGLGGAEARELALLVDQLMGARYGGPPVGDAPRAVREALARLAAGPLG